MEQNSIWNKIFFIHNYFFDCHFKYEYIQKSYKSYLHEWGTLGQTVDLFDFYTEVANNKIPAPINLISTNYKKNNYLLIENMDIDSLNHITDFEDLVFIDARINKIDSIVPIRKFKNLIKFDLSNNLISNIEPLNNFKNLRYLDLTSNFIFDLRVINSLENLWYLHLQSNKIDDLLTFDKLIYLQELDIANNNIKSLSGLTKLKELKKLNIGYNPLPIEELVAIKKALPDCKIFFEYYHDSESLGRFVEIILYEEIVFMLDYSNYKNESIYWIKYLDTKNNKKTDNINETIKKIIKKDEMKNSILFQKELKRKLFSIDDDFLVNCHIEY